MRFVFTSLLLAVAASAAPEYFPVVGGAVSQEVTIRLIALGTKQTVCRATLGFRSLAGEPLGETRQIELRIGQAARHTLSFSRLGLSETERIEVRPVVDLEAALSVCWPAVELATPHGTQVFGYYSGTTLRMRPPADARVSPFIDTGSQETLRVVVYRVDGDDAPQCTLNAGFRKVDGSHHGELQRWELRPGEARSMDYSPTTEERVLIDLRPSDENTGSGCVASAQVFDGRTATTHKLVPLALPRTSVLLEVPPARDEPDESHPDEPPSSARPIGQPLSISSPLGLPRVSIPEDNPPTLETIALGRRLFYDTILSADGTIACASCHDPAAGFSDPRPFSIGVNGAVVERHSMSILNAAFSPEVFWEGRSTGLEAQARMPVIGAREFAHSLQGVERRLQSDPNYVRWFEEAWGSRQVTYDMVAKSIATFERTLLSGNSPVDRYLFGGDRNALSEPALRAFAGFQVVCSQCHLIESSGNWATFGNNKFFNTGVAAVDFHTLKDQGRWKVTGHELDRGAFRPPSLRNLELTAPYMHDGSIANASGVAFFYNGGGRSNAWLSPMITPGPPGANPDFEAIEAFVRALTGDMPENAGPPDE